MKNLAVLFVLNAFFVSGTALAFPKVNDSANFDLAATLSSGQAFSGSFVLSLTEYNPSSKQFRQVQSLTVPAAGVDQTSDQWMNESDLITNAQASAYVSQCASSNGTPETISVPAGTFNTCKTVVNNDNSKGFAWIGVVPFGVVKQDLTDKENGMHMILNLKSFKAALE